MPSAARRKKARVNTNGVGEAADGADNGLTESVAASDCDMVNVDFEGRVPVASDTGGIAQLLGSLLPRAGVDWQQLAQLLTSEEALGCVLKQCWDSDNSDSDECESGDGDEEGEDVYGVCGILSLHQHRQNSALQRLCSSLLQRCRDSAASADTKQRFADILSLETAEGVGLLINERVANLPAQVALPLLTTLSSELSEARAAAADAGSDSLCRLTHLLLVCRLHSGKSQPGASSPSPAADPAAAACDDQPVWVHSEEVTVQRHAGRDWFQFSVAAECGSAVAGDWDDDDPALTPCRRVLLLPLASLATVVDQARRDDSRQRHTG